MQHISVLFYFLILPAVQVLLIGLLLWLGTRIARVESSRYRTCLPISLILAIAGTVAGALMRQNIDLRFLWTLVYLVLPVPLIKWYFKTSWAKLMLAGVFAG